MKISKLFHWLYAILMLLPFVFFVPSVLYYAFNDNATMQSVEAPKVETISVNFNQLNENPVPSENAGYYLPYNTSATSVVFDNNTIRCSIIDSVGTGWNLNYYYSVKLTSPSVVYSNHKYLFRFDLFSNEWEKYTVFCGNRSVLFDSTLGASSHFEGIFNAVGDYSRLIGFRFDNANEFGQYSFSVSNWFVFDLTQMYGVGNEPTLEEFNRVFPNQYYSYTESELMQITYDTGETQQLVENTDIINYAWESIWDLPLFSWSKVSFVAVPMTFLTGMFGLAASNSLNYVFAYFVSISIIYLLFDVIMYFPLMVHRWIDKARLE